MKLLIIRFSNEVDLSTLPSETEVSVSSETVSISGKVVLSTLPMADPEPPLTLPFNATIGPVTET